MRKSMVLVVLALVACAGTQLPKEDYRSRQQACIDTAVGRMDAGVVTTAQADAEATACRSKVQADYGRGGAR